MSLAHLSIGTSTNRIDLLSAGGYMLHDWKPGGYQHEAIFQESQLADFRQMAAYRDTTTIETMNLVLKSGTQNQAARAVQNLRAMLRMMLDFWTTTWQTDVVYLAARASCETNMRYSVIYDGRLVGEANPYGQPFLQPGGSTVMDELDLILERGPWLENPPGTGTGVQIGVTQTYDGRTVGNVDDTGTATPTTDARTVFVSNKHNIAQLTDIYYWDNSAGQWTDGGAPPANLMDAAVPFAFMPPAPLQVGDFVIFGIDSTLADSGPFSSLIFDIGTALGVGGGITITWKYSTAGAPAAWGNLTVQDNTNAAGAMTGDAFDTTGINSVHWEQPAWGTVNPNPGVALGITGYWVCAYVSAAAGNPTPPTQQNRDIYTVTWPYLEFDENQVWGDMPALLRLSVDSRSAQNATPSTTSLWSQRVLVGLRSVDRGDDFTAYVNLADEQNNAAITLALGASTAYANVSASPCGRCANYTPAGIEAWAARVYIRLSPDWYGRFHAFVRGRHVTGTPGEVNVRLGYSPTASAYPAERYTISRTFVSTSDDQLLDFGEIVLGPDVNVYPLEVSHTYLIIETDCTIAAAQSVYFYDLILIPVDEWAIDAEDVSKSTGDLGYTNDYWSHWEGDGIRNQRTILSYLMGTASGKIARYWRPITNGLPILQVNKQQRLWFLCARNDDYADVDDVHADSEICSCVQIWKQQRYTTLRGDQ